MNERDRGAVATLTKNDFPHLGSPLMIPTACALHRPSINQLCVGGGTGRELAGARR
jgi:hypothetical protein